MEGFGMTQALQVGTSLAGGLSEMAMRDFQADQARAEASAERDSAQQQARMIRRATRRESGAARAAMAASGTRLDEFSMINTNEIERLGEQDAAMTILTGNRRARTAEAQADLYGRAGRNALAGSLLDGATKAYSGWKGAKEPTDNFGGTMGYLRSGRLGD
jgi:hypothetical protein